MHDLGSIENHNYSYSKSFKKLTELKGASSYILFKRKNEILI